MEYELEIGNRYVTLEHADVDSIINIDDLTQINSSNLYGEAITIGVAINKVGIMKAKIEADMTETKLQTKIYEGNFIASLRKKAANNSGFYTIRVENEDVKIKVSETALRSSFETDKDWIRLQREYISLERDFNILSSLYWAIQDKARKLNNLVKSTTPEEFSQSLVEENLNTVIVKKK